MSRRAADQRRGSLLRDPEVYGLIVGVFAAVVTSFFTLDFILLLLEVITGLAVGSLFARKEQDDTLTRLYETVRNIDRVIHHEVIVSPKELHVFKELFEDAKFVRAYNPPLYLLINDETKTHRTIIINRLREENFRYRMIVGNDAFERVRIMGEAWANDSVREEVLRKIEICHWKGHGTDSDGGDLYSKVLSFGGEGSDLRGLSYFLIDRGEHSDGHYWYRALLYPLGKPFAKDFGIPTEAVCIDEKSPKADSLDCLYGKLRDTFDRRWQQVANKKDTEEAIGEMYKLDSLPSPETSKEQV